MAYDGNYIDDLDEGRPDGSVEFGNIVDDAIREIKRAVKNCFKAEHHGDSSGAHKFPFGNTANRPTGVSGRIYINTEELAIEFYNGTDWQKIADRFPSGTKLLFPMATPPVGWTKVTTWDDVTIIITSGSDGGTTDGQWAITGLTFRHYHTVDTRHTHTVPVNGWLDGYELQSCDSDYCIPYKTDQTLTTTQAGAVDTESSWPLKTGGMQDDNVSSDGLWRPAHLKVICAEKD